MKQTKSRKYLTYGVAVLAAAATAHVMQRGGDGPSLSVMPAEASMMAKPSPMPAAVPPALAPNDVTLVIPVAPPDPEPAAAPARDIAKPVLLAAAATGTPGTAVPLTQFPGMPRPPMDAVMPGPLPMSGAELQQRMASTTADPEIPALAVAREVRRNEFGLTCGPILTASPREAAMVGLTLTAPCRAEERFTLRHGELIYSASLDHLGIYSAEVPALAPDARFVVRFADGTEMQAETRVPMADAVERVALFSQGHSGLQIHALEFGADYGQAGHVWSGAPRDAATAARIGGGFLTVLGDSDVPGAQVAEVYTFPGNTMHRDGVVRLSVEAEITARNCGKDIAGRTLQKAADGALSAVSLTLAIPGCDAVGEFLVLKNLLRDLRLASN